MVKRKQPYRERSIKYYEKEVPDAEALRLTMLRTVSRQEVEIGRLRAEVAQLRYQLKRCQEAHHNAKLDLVGERARKK